MPTFASGRKNADRFGKSALHRASQGPAERAALTHQIKRGEA